MDGWIDGRWTAEKEWERGNEKMGNKEQESSDIGYLSCTKQMIEKGKSSVQ